MIQTIIALFIVALALAWVLVRLYKSHKSPGCSCGCSASSCSHCPTATRTRCQAGKDRIT